MKNCKATGKQKEKLPGPKALAEMIVAQVTAQTVACLLQAAFDEEERDMHVGFVADVEHRLALVSRPDIIFADEPSGNLDSTSGAELLSFMRQAVREFDQTIVMVTHDPVAAGYADRVVFLADGTVVDEMHDPTPERVLDRMKTLGG